MAIYNGTGANNTRLGSANDDTFNYGQGGNDTLRGLGGNDTFKLGASFTAADVIDGGGGINTLILNGNYAAGVVFNATTMVGIGNLNLTPGFSYKFTLHNNVVPINNLLTINGQNLGLGQSLKVNGAPETNGRLTINAGQGNDTLVGGGKNDIFNLATGGTDSAKGNNGNDTFNMGTRLDPTDRLQGGNGAGDKVVLGGTQSVLINGAMLKTIEIVAVSAGADYGINTADGLLTGVATMTIDASALGIDDNLTFNGSAESTAGFRIISGNGQDLLSGGDGSDRFDFTALTNHDATRRDIITNFDRSDDFFKIKTVGGVLSLVGSVSSGSIDSDLNTLAGPSAGGNALGAGAAALIQVTGGDLAGSFILLVDLNNTIGYDIGVDLVIQVNTVSGGNIDPSDFIA